MSGGSSAAKVDAAALMLEALCAQGYHFASLAVGGSMIVPTCNLVPSHCVPLLSPRVRPESSTMRQRTVRAKLLPSRPLGEIAQPALRDALGTLR